MPTLDDEQMALFPYVTSAEFVPRFVARYWDMMACADRQPALVIDKGGSLKIDLVLVLNSFVKPHLVINHTLPTA